MARPTAWICEACGTQFAASARPPGACPICEDERQFVPPGGQRWTDLAALRREHRNTVERVEERLLRIGTEPDFAIGQVAHLVGTPEGAFLWDLVALLDESIVQLVRDLGGLAGIAISHPHYYTTLCEWSATFGNVPVYLHAADREWLQRPCEAVELWEGDTFAPVDGLTLLRCGGHFPGATVLHWRDGADGAGALLSGDVIQVVQDRRRVSFMYSYPNLIPLGRPAVERIVAAVQPYEFDRIYGAFGRDVTSDAKAVVERSAARYLAAIESNQRS